MGLRCSKIVHSRSFKARNHKRHRHDHQLTFPESHCSSLVSTLLFGLTGVLDVGGYRLVHSYSVFRVADVCVCSIKESRNFL